MAVSGPPKKKASEPTPIQQDSKGREREIEKIISRGSSTVGKDESQDPERIKNFNVKIMSGQLNVIDQLREKRPRKPTSPKLGVSLQDWIMEAIEEKIEREKKKYK